ncbi:uncharacterized protein LOC132946925 isoform X1 [Metopolophium dirhodum]|uniref:uncharacterized protein LOC132946925 isoform X1 n=1 Tax=Metopolophium dirhodum TaxID=44670 RepID=UPI00298F8223|nr:uncharacterized protein LOC132946925 isoform X1 [Metopolophium dirhodum]
MGITTCADWGFPFTTIELQMFTKCFLESAGVGINKFKNNTPGSESVRSFLKRHQNVIGKRLTQNITKARAGKNKRRKNKRLRIAPGVSVTANDSEEVVTEEAHRQVNVDNTDSIVVVSEDIQNQLVYESINIGKYLLVQLKSSRIKGTIYKYAVIVIKKTRKDELQVNGLKSMDSQQSTFKFVENDVFTITLDDVISLLPEPQVIVLLFVAELNTNSLVV